jgi:hypothetical protein
MRWIAPTEKAPVSATSEIRLWDTVDQLRANSTSEARGSEQEIRQKLIENRSVGLMLAVGNANSFN